ncbi:MAG: hypothetical protein V4736_14610 [Bdellovibrionota bacterium]
MSKIFRMRKFILLFLFGVTIFFNGCGRGGGFRSVSSVETEFGLDTGSGSPTPTPSGPIAKGEMPSRARLGDRFYIASVLEEIFTTGTAASDAAVKTAIQQKIVANAHFFGGIAHEYDPPEYRTLSSIEYTGSGNYANVGAPASAVLISTCTSLNETAGVVGIVETKAGLTGNLTPVANDFASLYKLFYPAKSSNTAALSALENLFNQVKTKSNRADALKVVIYTLCTSPDWTVL